MENNCVFKAFVINSAEYDNYDKDTGGAWLEFPTTKDEVTVLFKKIGLPNNVDNNNYIIYKYSGDNDIVKFLSVYTNIDELNYLASRITELNNIEILQKEKRGDERLQKEPPKREL